MVVAVVLFAFVVVLVVAFVVAFVAAFVVVVVVDVARLPFAVAADAAAGLGALFLGGIVTIELTARSWQIGGCSGPQEYTGSYQGWKGWKEVGVTPANRVLSC